MQQFPKTDCKAITSKHQFASVPECIAIVDPSCPSESTDVLLIEAAEEYHLRPNICSVCGTVQTKFCKSQISNLTRVFEIGHFAKIGLFRSLDDIASFEYLWPLLLGVPLSISFSFFCVQFGASFL